VSRAGSLKRPGKFEEPGQEGWGRFLCQAASKGLKSPLAAQGWRCSNQGSFTPGFREVFGYLLMSSGEGG
jgi:hypothetical protein